MGRHGIHDSSQSVLSIEALPEGGFIVFSDGGREGFARIQWYASSDIKDALEFIELKLKKEPF